METTNRTESARKPVRDEIRVKSHSCQPGQADVNEDVKIDGTPDELALSVLRQVSVVEDPDA